MCAAKFFEFFEHVNKPRGGTSGRAAGPPTTSSGEPLTVSQLTGLIDEALRDSLPPSLLVRGEVSNFNHHRGSGHAYFTLKDADACVDCVMFKSDFSRVKFTPKDGMELLARGRIGVYPQRGRYQLYVGRLDPIGQGALELAFKQLCAKLEKEGLFRAERKKLVPKYPQRIAILTSTQTAALQDMLKVLRRFPWLKLFICNVPVQGDGAAERIAAAIAHLGRTHQSIGGIDVILLGRGGGSLEDLWEFNEEVLARAIVASPIPTVSGVGHEVDVTIADLAADARAHTPTEAAQVVTGNWRTARDVIDAISLRLRRELRKLIVDARQRLLAIERHAIFRRPLDRINAARQLLDDRQKMLLMLMSARVRRLHARLLQVASRLHERHPRHAILLERQRLNGFAARLHRAISQSQVRRRERIAALLAHLNAVSPQRVLNRGYTITTLRKTGAILRSARQVRLGDRVITQFADGTAQSVVEDQRQLPLFE